MFLIGIILLILGAASGFVAFVSARAETTTIHLSAFGFARDAQPLEVLIVGAASVLVFCIGWALLAGAMRRRARIRREGHERERLTATTREAESQRVEHENEIESQRVEHEREIESQRAEYQGHLDQARLRDEDLSRREQELAEHRRDLEAREKDVTRLEAAYHEKVSPSVADVVTGRASGRVSEGTAVWADPAKPDASKPDPAKPDPTSPRRPTGDDDPGTDDPGADRP